MVVVTLAAVLVVMEEGSVLVLAVVVDTNIVVVAGVPLVIVKGPVVPCTVVEAGRVCVLTSWERRHKRAKNSPQRRRCPHGMENGWP